MKIFIISLIMLLIHLYEGFAGDTLKIQTPLNHQDTTRIHVEGDRIWNDDSLENCYQSYLYSGGIFKQSSSGDFSEKNNYIQRHDILCFEIVGNTIYAGTNDGIIVSTNKGSTWANPSGFDSLKNKKVNAIGYGNNLLYACTDNGLYRSSNNGSNWDRKLIDTIINCLAFSNGITYLGTDKGVYQDSSSIISYIPDIIFKITSIFITNDTIYAGTSRGIWRKNDNDLIFRSISYSPISTKTITAIRKINDYLYFAIEKDGCFYSSDECSTWNDKNSGFQGTSGNYSRINMFNHRLNSDTLYMASDTGLYASALPWISSWKKVIIKDPMAIIEDYKVNKLIFDVDTLWTACYGGVKYPNSRIISNPPDPYKFPNYHCHSYAWHLAEGGESLVMYNYNDVLKYRPPSGANEWEKNNWDYIEVVATDSLPAWKNELWEKITYSTAHSGIKSPNNDPNNNTEDSVKVVSKWDTGPLMEHLMKESPYTYNNYTKFWTSRKYVSGAIDENQQISREISTIENEETLIAAGSHVEFKVAPMQNHKIHLKPGFRAESGSYFRAYVDTTCQIPWEIKLDTVQIIAQKPRNQDFLLSKLFIDDKVDLRKSEEPLNQVVNEWPGKGSGTNEDPYQISDIYQFQAMGHGRFQSGYFVLTNDIDATVTRYWRIGDHDRDPNTPNEPMGWQIISTRAFLDGRGFQVRNLYSNEYYSMPTTIFSDIDEKAVISNLCMVDLDIRGTSSSSGFVGINEGIIKNCYVSGRITSRLSLIDMATSTGFCGHVNDGTIENCYSECIIFSDTLASSFYPYPDQGYDGIIKNCYATGNVYAKEVLPPFPLTQIENCFWDTATTGYKGITGGPGCKGLSTEEMRKRSTFESAGWDFDSTWYIEEGIDYPRLQVFRRDTTKSFEPVEVIIFEIYPNPASECLYVKYLHLEESRIEIRVFNSLGICVISQTQESVVEKLDLSALPAGMYFLTIQSGGQSVTEQFAVVR